MKAIRTFCFPHQGHRVWHPCAQPQHMFSRKYDDPQLKKKKKRCLSCTAVSQMQCRQLKLHCLFLMTKMVSGTRSRTHQSINCKFHPFWFSPPQPPHVIFPLDALPLDCPVVISILLFSLSLALGTQEMFPFPWKQAVIATHAVIKTFSHFFSWEDWV